MRADRPAREWQTYVKVDASQFTRVIHLVRANG
jgi:hypothetical protein